MSVGYQYLPFEVYARSDFKSTVGQAYEWSGSFHAYQQRQEAIEMGMKDEEGNPLEPLEKPGKKVSLSDGLAQWQKDLREYGQSRALRLSRDWGWVGIDRYTRPIPAYYVTSHCASRCAPCPLKIKSGSYTSISSVSFSNTRPRPPVVITLKSSPELFAELTNRALHTAQERVIQTGLHAGLGVGAQNRIWSRNFHFRQLGRISPQSGRTGTDAGGDDAGIDHALVAHVCERGGGAEISHQHWAAILVIGTGAVGQNIRTQRFSDRQRARSYRS